MHRFFVVDRIETRTVVRITEAAHSPVGMGSCATGYNWIKFTFVWSVSQFYVHNENSVQDQFSQKRKITESKERG
jgi:hypothetical protein